MADKGLFFIYGLIFIVILNYSKPQDYGLYALLIAIQIWIFTISDSFALQSIIQFGMNEENRKKVNLISLVNHLSITILSSIIIFIFKENLADLFNETRIIELAYYLPILTISFIPKSFCQKIIYRDQKMFLIFLSNLFFFGINSIYILLKIYLKGSLDFKDLTSGYLYGSLFSSLLSILLIRRELVFGFKGNIGIKEIFSFNWKMTFGSLLYGLPRQLDTILLKLFFNLELIGLYSAAKTIFRVFDELLSAIAALVYPSTVKHYANKNIPELETLISKTFSLGFFFFGISFIILISGGSELIFSLPFIPVRYYSAIHYFNILIFCLPFLPFTAIYLVYIAANRLFEYFIFTLIGIVVFISFTIFIGINNYSNYMPLGITSFFIIEGFMGFLLSKSILKIKYKSIFRIVNDLKNYFHKDK